MMTFSYFWLKQLIGMDASRYADDCQWFVCACVVVFPAKMMEQTIVMSYNDVMRISRA